MINYIQLVQDVEDGVENPFKAKAILEELQKEVKECLDQIKPIVIDEASKYSSGDEVQGFKIEKRNGKKTYNFKGIKEWEDANKTKLEVEDIYKQYYSLYEKGKLVADGDTGEIPQLPEVKYSDEVIVVKNLGESLLR